VEVLFHGGGDILNTMSMNNQSERESIPERGGKSKGMLLFLLLQSVPNSIAHAERKYAFKLKSEHLMTKQQRQHPQ
jgi:hypothetical protein